MFGKRDAVCPSAPQAEQDEIQPDVAEERVVFVGRSLGAELASDPVCLRRLGLEPVEQVLARETVVRALVVGRDAAVVSPPERSLAPVRLQLGRELVGAAGGVPSGEGDRVPRPSGLDERVGENRGCLPGSSATSNSTP